MIHHPLVFPLSKINRHDLDLVGRKAVELGELIHLGINIPKGFAVVNAPLTKDTVTLIHKSYKQLTSILFSKKVKVFSSPKKDTDKVLRYEVKGDANLLLKIKTILASGSPAIVQEIIKSSQKWTAYTQNQFTGDKTEIILKEDDSTSPPYVVSKTDLSILAKGQSPDTRNDRLIHEFAEVSKKIQKHLYHPQQIEFVTEKNKIYVVDIKPLMTTYQRNNENLFPHLTSRAKVVLSKPTDTKPGLDVLLKGISTFPGIATGRIKVFHNVKQISNIVPSDVVVIPQLDISLFDRVKIARALVTDSSSLSAHDTMIYSKVVGIPTITAVKDATKVLHTGTVVTVNGTKGEIYKGGLN